MLGSFAALFLHQAGAKVVAVSDVSGGLRHSRGTTDSGFV